jgi:FKBP-type peptidyl-prolyl cis-trans isomerase
MFRSTRSISLAALVFVPAVFASCLSLDSTVPEAATVETTTFASSLNVNLAASTRTANGAYYRDLVVGTGPVIVVGQKLGVRYTGWFADGTKFESNVGVGDPLVFTFGTAEVIDGWDEALAGVKVGGKRQLLIPPSLAYGPYTYGPIPGNSVLVFEVEVITAQ